jgi:phosphate transport system ATP-binding protein
MKITDGPATKTSLALKAESRGLNFFYGAFQALKGIDMPIYDKKVTALIGPSGCGKSTYLRCFNRMHDLYPGNRYEGEIRLHPDNTNLLNPHVDPIEVRMRISMVFQKPNPFPKSIYENVAYGLRVRGVRGVATLDEKVEQALRGAALWDEVKDRLNDLAFNLSGGQQQRMCIARALATEPEILLFDEPTSALDPEMINEVLDVMVGLAQEGMTMMVVTHEMGFARKVANRVIFMDKGLIVEDCTKDEFFGTPRSDRARDFLAKIIH